MAKLPKRLQDEVQRLRNLTRGRPANPPAAGPGQESVWDYPRPPRLAPDDRPVQVFFVGEIIADSRRAIRVLETASPPTFYLPPADVRTDLLRPSGHRTVCEWKGPGQYWDVVVGDAVAANAVWGYPQPWPGFESIAGYFAFYPGRVDACTVAGEPVRPQPGAFYGGWVTDEIIGPFKGEPGTEGW